ncbi:MAG: response regulator transcription factor [Acutalibacteraceae bacterium]|jgi:DNA-binding response OmpR family regulator
MAIRILIVEDDPHIGQMLQVALAIVRYESDLCDNGADALEQLMSGRYDLALLDVMLPGQDGFSVMERAKDAPTPVIFLTARQDVVDRVKGLRLGAEDYIVKPFETVELLARIEVVLRRTHRTQEILTYGEIVLNLSEHTVKKGGVPVALTPKEFDVLAFFIRHPDLAITRERLLSAVWGYEFAGESRTVDIHVQQLRRKMGLQNRLVTIPKLGYRLESEGGR